MKHHRHGYIEKRDQPLTDYQVSKLYSQSPLANFSHYNYPYYRMYKNTTAPIVWFVSHCKAHSGRWGFMIINMSHISLFRDRYIHWLQKWIGVDIYGKCGDKHCGKVKNVGNEYSTTEDPCFDMVNKKYR